MHILFDCDAYMYSSLNGISLLQTASAIQRIQYIYKSASGEGKLKMNEWASNER